MKLMQLVMMVKMKSFSLWSVVLLVEEVDPLMVHVSNVEVPRGSRSRRATCRSFHREKIPVKKYPQLPRSVPGGKFNASSIIA